MRRFTAHAHYYDQLLAHVNSFILRKRKCIVHSVAKVMAPGKREAALVQIPHPAVQCPRGTSAGTSDHAFRQISTLLTLSHRHHEHYQARNIKFLAEILNVFAFFLTDEVTHKATQGAAECYPRSRKEQTTQAVGIGCVGGDHLGNLPPAESAKQNSN